MQTKVNGKRRTTHDVMSDGVILRLFESSGFRMVNGIDLMS